jgi:galactonate dehydratase
VKIVEVRPLVLGTAWRNLTFVVVRTDEGIEGVGEVRMINHTDALLGYLAEAAPNHVLGADPFEIEDLVGRMMRNDYARAGQIAMSGIACIETACWDIAGKALDQPVYRLLGGAVRDRIKAYANGWYTVERTAEEFYAAARRAVDRGYRALKLDPFGAASAELAAADRRRAVSIVAAVREAVGPDVQILIEMHGRFTPATAVRVASLLEPYDPEWIEEPVPPENASALARVQRATRIPIATGERAHSLGEIRELVERGIADVVQIDLTHFGGFLGLKRVAGWAEAHYLLMAPHNVCGPVGTMANVHAGIATPNYKILEHFNDFADSWVQDLVDAPPRVAVEDGCFALPTRPGLGVTLNHNACAAHPRTGGRLKLFEKGWEKRGSRS